MGKNKKLTLGAEIETFPDGVHAVPVTLEDGRLIGTALVTFCDGDMDTIVQMTSTGFKELGVKLVFEESYNLLEGYRRNLIASKKVDE